ncbi:TetR/AcrR family transcriptional regulator [Paenibacillus rhizolycopersici]|uniref:TetR/AcrR family transcriptional regulator n=1 Tax=Paenibacillus rhizolycopersici TaxID=2780073 RepID=UPI003D27402C
MSQMTKSDEQKTNVQERILNCAEELFANSSYSATRISDIAAKAGVNQALVHYYFDTKEKLYQAVLMRLFSQWESYVEGQSWENVHPELVLKQYIKTHFDIKCKIPNLYKIFHKESLEGGKLFDRYASSKWFQDFFDKNEMFKEWKRAGILNPHVNVQVVLFCLWGMMNQFYYRDTDSLAMITGYTGTKEELQEVIADQMIGIAQHGLLMHNPVKEENDASDGKGRNICVFFDPAAGEAEQDGELSAILEAMQGWNGCTVNVIRSLEGWRDRDGSEDFLFVAVSSKYGELSEDIVHLLRYWETNSGAIADRFVGIWTKREGAASDAVQRVLEEHINRYGGFAVSRISEHTVHGYLNRCVKMAGI